MQHQPNPRKQLAHGVPYVGMLLVGLLPAPLKRAYYRRKGARIGQRVALGWFSFIQSPDIVLADDVSIAPFTFIRARGRCHIGARSRIHAFTAIDTGIFEMGEDSAILEQVTIGGMLTPRSALHIGSRVKIFSYSFLNPTEAITIGDEAGVGGANYIFTHGSWQSVLDGFPASFGPVTIERGVWLPWRVFIMPNVTIGEYATIGAGAIITRDIPARSLAVGSPAKAIKTGAEYIREPDAAHKDRLVREWMQEFAAYLTYLGWNAQCVLQGDGVRLNVVHRRQGAASCLYHAQAPADTSATLVLSLEAMDNATRSALTQADKGWFDIGGHACRLHPHPLTKELRNFLGRYGVRFAVV